MKLYRKLSVCFTILLFILKISFLYGYCNNDCPYGYYNNGAGCEECGVTQVTPNVRIFGGQDALPKSWPAHVLIRQRVFVREKAGTNATVYISCGGTLINRRTVLTAASCIIEDTLYVPKYSATINIRSNYLYPTYESSFQVYIGAYNIGDIRNNADNYTQWVTVSKVIKHSDFSHVNYQNDIALLILTDPITPSDKINVACIPMQSRFFPPYGSTAYVIGWGRTSANGASANDLNNVAITVYDQTKCSNVYATIPKLRRSQLCAGDINGATGTCSGDSGGGSYVSQTISGRDAYFVLGITSYGEPCGKKPSIFTRVSFFTYWIMSNWEV